MSLDARTYSEKVGLANLDIYPTLQDITKKHQYHQKHLKLDSETDLNPDTISEAYAKLVELVNQEPTRVRELLAIVRKLIFLTSHILVFQGHFDQDLVGFLNTLPRKIKIVTE